MSTFIALLRAVNVGGTGKLPMAELKATCEDAGFTDVKTYIQSGNVVFNSKRTASGVLKSLSDALAARVGREIRVLLRTREEMHAIVEANPFPAAPPSRVIVMFYPQAPPKSLVAQVEPPGGEQLHLSNRELYVYYINGQGRSKLRVPQAEFATGRNINTLSTLASMADAAAG